MPLIGERQKYYRELAALHNEVRRKPLERRRVVAEVATTLCIATLIVLMLVVCLAVVLASAFVW